MRETLYFLRYFYRLHPRLILFTPALVLFAGGFDAMAMGSFFLVFSYASNEASAFSARVADLLAFVNLPYHLWTILLVANISYLLRSTFMLGMDVWISRAVAYKQYELQTTYLDRMLQVTYSYFCSKEAGALNHALSQEFQRLCSMIGAFAKLISYFAYAAVYVGIAMWCDWKSTMMLAAAGSPVVFFVRWLNRRIKANSLQYSLGQGRLLSTLGQIFQYFKYLKATSSTAPVKARFSEQSRGVANALFRFTFLQSISENGLGIISVSLVSALIFYQCGVEGRPIPEVILPLYVIKRAIDQILSLQQSYRKFLTCYGSIHVIDKLTVELAENTERCAGEAPGRLNKPIEFKQVGFSYRNDRPILTDISLTIRPNSTVAFVGESGSGKSTLVTMLTGILRPTAGELYLDGMAYEQLDLQALRARIGYVTQESVVFSDSVKNNVTLWQSPVEAERFASALRRAELARIVAEMEQKEETPLGDNGTRFSGGQRQRLSIARELYRDADLLIFDEATSALDSATEHEIQRSIDQLRGTATVVMIAHRLSTVRNADLIYVLKNGRVAEYGTFSQLAAAGGEFQRMLALQSLAPAVGKPEAAGTP